jgi:hypothetical protein
MTEMVSNFDSKQLIGLVAVAGGLLCGLILGTLGIILGFFAEAHKTRRAETLAALKQDMLNRGMSAEEIRTVLEAGVEGSRNAVGRRSCRV